MDLAISTQSHRRQTPLISYRLTGNKGRMNGLSGGVSAIGDVKPWRQ